MNEVAFTPIGIIRTDHVNPDTCPIQPIFAAGSPGRVVVRDDYAAGLKDLEAFSHIYLVYHLHKVDSCKLIVRPYLQDHDRGVFATRAPYRPNPIGLSIVRLVRREGNTLYVDGADMLDGSPLLDIKPYTERFDQIRTESNGWQDEVDDRDADRRGRRLPPED